MAFPDDMTFDTQGHIVHFGLNEGPLMEMIRKGRPFMTTGCSGSDGQVACNRPFGNCLPDVKQWNYPYLPNDEEKDLISNYIFSRKIIS